MKTILPQSPLLLAWINQTQPHARNRSRNPSLSFEGPVLRSYELPIARILSNGVVFVRYADSTSRTNTHIQDVKVMISRKTFVVPDVMLEPHQLDSQWWIDNCLENTRRGQRSRIYGRWHLNYAERCLATAAELSTIFSLNWNITTPVELIVLKTKLKLLAA